MNAKTKKTLSIMLTCLCLGVFIYAAYGLIDTAIDYYKNRKVLNNLQETFYNADHPVIDDESASIRSGFDRLLKENDELVGWITIEGTQIDYPILQADNNVDYLRRNFYKEKNIAGSIFMDFRNDVQTPGLNTILYGHRMKDGSMFEQLTKFQDKDFFKNHQTFEYDTLYDSYVAEIFAVYITKTDFDYIQTDFSTDEEYEQLLAGIREKSMYETDVEVKADDHILTLSTCDYALDPNDGRLVVQAKLVKKG
ncbi:class B sortase [Sporosarcina pasteurii]|uniref:Sortase (Surface protein transpeptidase) n=1 Tax=Sporosarcina pasteurii TaxID=1474 RepID=A0A380C923_SPOPA|nr:class B sortase [Sporosarcina pasteurii]MDS9472741.1 class B sortase [Sporosarcina pasteurii]QBQ04394.1 class B sortase [Sporosarcina pasteurii]SUJ15413.1 Sortase (surface protein transpeptidase) [Sporosarcina pasteurii]